MARKLRYKTGITHEYNKQKYLYYAYKPVYFTIIVFMYSTTYLSFTAILSGVTFSLSGDSIPTDGSGRVLITTINPTGDNNDDALICHSEISFPNDVVGDWYLHPIGMSVDDDDRIVGPINGVLDRGWNRNRGFDSSNRRLVRLRRISTTAEEGVFTCDIPGDDNTPGYLGVYYPSESFC